MRGYPQAEQDNIKRLLKILQENRSFPIDSPVLDLLKSGPLRKCALCVRRPPGE